jgi:hypothetical protein
MLLHEWMIDAPMSPEDLATVLSSRGHQVKASMVRKAKSGRRRFSPEICREIVTISGGKVSLEELLFGYELKNPKFRKQPAA